MHSQGGSGCSANGNLVNNGASAPIFILQGNTAQLVFPSFGGVAAKGGGVVLVAGTAKTKTISEGNRHTGEGRYPLLSRKP
jgi:hypothetical protein